MPNGTREQHRDLVVAVSLGARSAAEQLAQVFNLLYRRFTLGWHLNCSGRSEQLGGPQIGNLRYSRLKICATAPLLAAALLLFVWSCLSAADLNGRFTVDVFSTAQGLPSSVVLAVTQTRDGYLWAGTLAGLARFDGVQFDVFDENNTPGLKSSQIRRLYEDRQTNLWVGTEDGGIAIVKPGRVSSVDIGQGRYAGRLMSICEDTSGAVLLYTDGGLLARYRSGRVDVRAVDSGAQRRCRALVAENSGHLWLGTDTELATLNPASLAPEDATPMWLSFLLPSKAGGYWRLANGVVQKCQGSMYRSSTLT